MGVEYTRRRGRPQMRRPKEKHAGSRRMNLVQDGVECGGFKGRCMFKDGQTKLIEIRKT